MCLERKSHCERLLNKNERQSVPWKRLHILSHHASSAKYLEVKRAAEDQDGWRAINRRAMPQNCYTVDY